MDNRTKWNELVSDVKDHQNDAEVSVQSLWADYFADADFFGYSRRRGEVDQWRKIRIGSSERTIPDIVLRNATEQVDLCVIELKQHNLPFCERYKEQLFSYMRLLELKIGILICKQLYIFYRQDATHEFALCIPFECDNPNGEKFIELFSRENFSQEAIYKFLKSKQESDTRLRVLKQELSQLSLKNLIVSHFSDRYSIEEISKILDCFEITIRQKLIQKPITDPKPQPTPEPIPTSPTNKLSKREAIALCVRNGYVFAEKRNISFSSKNDSQLTDIYWSNPPVDALTKDWDIILNDWVNRKLYVFRVPAYRIPTNALRVRSDQPRKIDLQIYYGDPTFTDSRSGVRFHEFLQMEIPYPSATSL